MEDLKLISKQLIENINHLIIPYNKGKSIHLEGEEKLKRMHSSAWYKIRKAQPQETVSFNIDLFRPKAYPRYHTSIGQVVIEKGIDHSESDYGTNYTSIKIIMNKGLNTKDKKLPRFTIEYSDLSLTLDGQNRKDHERFIGNVGWVKTDLSKQIPSTWFQPAENNYSN